MTAKIGRATTLTWGGAPLGGVREKSVAFNGEVVDITSDDDSGFRKLIEDDYGAIQVDISLSGITKADTLFTDAFAKVAKTLIMTRPSGAMISGTFMIASVQEGNPYKDGRTFSAEFRSSGTIAFTPAP